MFPPTNSKILDFIFFSQTRNISKIFLNFLLYLQTLEGRIYKMEQNDAEYNTNLKCFDLLLHFL